MDKNKYHRLFAPCIPVKGFRRSIIADINRHQLFYIPNCLFRMLTRERNKSLSELIDKYGPESQAIITSYFDFLLRNELVFPFNKEELVHFPKLSLQWDFPSYCSNAILDIARPSSYDVPKAITQLDEIACFHLQIRLLREVNLSYLERLLELTNDTSIRTVQLVMNYCQVIDEQLHRLFEKYWKLVKVEMLGSSENRSIPLKGNLALIIYHANKVLAPENCGVVSTDYFCIEMKHFTESQRHNTCLNRKMHLQPIHLPLGRTRGLRARGGMWHLFTRNRVCARQGTD